MVIKHFKDTYEAWKLFLGTRTNIFLSAAIMAFALVVFVSFSSFLSVNETRIGSLINDPILNSFSPADMTIPLFIMIYGLSIAAIVNLMKYPLQFVFGSLAYVMMLSFRLLTLYLLPLEPPTTMILLTDPVTQLFAQDTALTKDLFFSGHTATAFLFFLLVKGKKIKAVAFIFFVLTGAFVIMQHVHYSIDVVVAPFIAFSCYKIAEFFKRRYVKKPMQI